MQLKQTTWRQRYSRSTHAMSCNPARTDEDRLTERDKRSAKPLTWSMLQKLIHVHTNRNLEKSMILHARKGV